MRTIAEFRKIVLPLLCIVMPLCVPNFVYAREILATHSIFIPIDQGFSFAKGNITDIEEGDIVVSAYGIELSSLKLEIVPLDKGFIEDILELPEEEVLDWTNFADYDLDMLYAVRCADKNYALFELIDVKVSESEIIGIEIKYKYQPDGSRKFP